mgnify:CR=1 FL=1
MLGHGDLIKLPIDVASYDMSTPPHFGCKNKSVSLASLESHSAFLGDNTGEAHSFNPSVCSGDRSLPLRALKSSSMDYRIQCAYNHSFS